MVKDDWSSSVSKQYPTLGEAIQGIPTMAETAIRAGEMVLSRALYPGIWPAVPEGAASVAISNITITVNSDGALLAITTVEKQ